MPTNNKYQDCLMVGMEAALVKAALVKAGTAPEGSESGLASACLGNQCQRDRQRSDRCHSALPNHCIRHRWVTTSKSNMSWHSPEKVGQAQRSDRPS